MIQSSYVPYFLMINYSLLEISAHNKAEMTARLDITEDGRFKDPKKKTYHPLYRICGMVSLPPELNIFETGLNAPNFYDPTLDDLISFSDKPTQDGRINIPSSFSETAIRNDNALIHQIKRTRNLQGYFYLVTATIAEKEEKTLLFVGSEFEDLYIDIQTVYKYNDPDWGKKEMLAHVRRKNQPAKLLTKIIDVTNRKKVDTAKGSRLQSVKFELVGTTTKSPITGSILQEQSTVIPIKDISIVLKHEPQRPE